MNTTVLETTLPGATRRRLWSHPEVQSHSLVVLTFSQLYVTPCTGTPPPEFLTAVETGELHELLGPFAIRLELIALRRVKLDLLNNTLLLDYDKDGLTTSRLTIVFANPQAADACFTKIWRRLGDGHRLLPYKKDLWSRIKAPLSLLVSALVITAVLTLLLSVLEDTAAARAAGALQPPGENQHLHRGLGIVATPWEWFLAHLNWPMVCAWGGIVAAIAQVWLYRRLTSPPTALELVRA
ncbi:MAG: hypothetical protein RMJ56_06935 [Gemmataceae bacterium]|nr:hypothetical protein [Gemmata sp.]MDW8197324.1 hypothetical protein [Gemmataceae bacterium]